MTEALDYVAQSKLGHQLPRRARHAGARLSLCRAAARTRSPPPTASSRAASAPGDRVALIAETAAEFVALFFGALYAGVWPVPLPLPTSFGGKEAYIDQLAVQLKSADPALLLYPPELADGRRRGRADRRRRASTGHRFFAEEADAGAARRAPRPTTSPICNIRAARPASRTASSSPTARLLSNLAAHAHSMHIGPGDRGVSWLPFYHDMGLVGCMLSMIANQMSVDYLKTEDFARRPLAWLDLDHAATKSRR